MRQVLTTGFNYNSTSVLALVFLTHSFTCACLWLVFRLGDPDIERQILGMVCFSLAFFGATSFLGRRQVNPWLLPVGVTLLMLLPILLSFVGKAGFLLSILLGIAGLICVIAVLFEYASKIKTGKMVSWLTIPLTIGLGCSLGAYFFLSRNTDPFAPIMGDIWIFFDKLIGDTVFHSAIAHILYNYNIPSTGLDGTPFLFYHIGIHRWVASSMHIFGGMPVTLFAISRDIVWIPIFLFTLTSVTSYVNYWYAQREVSWVWSVALVFTFDFTSIWSSLPLINSSMWSESFLFSLPIFLSFIPMGINWLNQVTDESRPCLRPVQLLFFTIAIITCSMAKMSTGLILVTYLVSCLMVPRIMKDFRRWFKIAIFLVSVSAALLYGVKETFLPSTYQFSFFYSYRSEPLLSIYHLLIFGLCIKIVWYILRDRRCLRRNLCVVIAITFSVGQIPGLLYAFEHSGWNYFSLPVSWLCYIIAAACVLNSVTVTVECNSQQIIRPKLLSVLAIAFMAYTLLIQVKGKLPDFYKVVLAPTNVMMKQVLLADGSSLGQDVEQDKRGNSIDKLSRFRHRLVEGKSALLRHTQLGRVKRTADDLRSTDTAIYIPPENLKFWREFDNSDENTCWFRSLAVPAVTGLPMVNGITAGVGDCPNTEYFGMNVYRSESKNLSLSGDQLCRRAQKLGFRKVLIIEEDGHRVEDCGS